MILKKQTVEQYPIDFVIPWVDGSDPDWLRTKQRYETENVECNGNEWTNGDSRFRDWGLLRYWFRGVELFAPWVNHIWFVTYGHIPNWLNVDHPKLSVIKHDEFIPKEYLPTFSSHTIELNLHRISGLAEHFVYFNDDMFLISGVKPQHFFRHGNPCDTAVLLPILLVNNGIRAEINDMYVIHDHFDKRSVMRRNTELWYSYKYGRLLLRTILLSPFSHFPGFYISHLPCSYLKKTFEEVWNSEPDILNKTCENRFRSVTDVNQWLFEYWQFCTGCFYPRSPDFGKYYEGERMIGEMCKDIRTQKYHMICCNDSPKIHDFNSVRERVSQAFESILGELSEFERYR